LPSLLPYSLLVLLASSWPYISSLFPLSHPFFFLILFLSFHHCKWLVYWIFPINSFQKKKNRIVF
jgi:hypothetical protein